MNKLKTHNAKYWYKFMSEQHISLYVCVRSTWAELVFQTLLFIVQLLQYAVLLAFDMVDRLADLRMFFHHLWVAHPDSLVVVLDPKLQVFPVMCTIYVFISSKIWLIYMVFLSHFDMIRCLMIKILTRKSFSYSLKIYWI